MANRPGWEKRHKIGIRRRGAICLAVALGLAVSVGGCTRAFFRKRADQEVCEVLREKDKYPEWKIEQYHVYPDPRARFGDPTNPDRPPKPPDDPAAYDLSPNPQKPGKGGVAKVEGQGYLELLGAWDARNRAENPPQVTGVGALGQTGSTSALGSVTGAPNVAGSGSEATNAASGPRPFLITLEQSAEFGLINSREYQDRREDLYLTALPVTLQRFAFSAQFFAAGQAIREWAGRDAPEGKFNGWRLNSATGFTKLFSTGALLLFQVANQTVINFTGPLRGTTSESTLSLDLIQPLLRGGGRAVTLEPLTQTERNLLYEIRTFARFREEFFVAIAGGGGGSISGGSFVPTGVIASLAFSPAGGVGGSGLTPGLIAPVPVTGSGPQVTPGGSGRLNLTSAIPAPVAGYLGTLLQFVQIDFDRDNITKLEEFLRLFQAFREGGDVSQLQVDQVEQQLLQGRSTLLTDQNQYQDALDRFKLQLGLPTNLPLALDDTAIRPLVQQFRRYEEVFVQFETAGKSAEDLAGAAPLTVRDRLRQLAGTTPIVQDTRFREQFPARWAALERQSGDALSRQMTAFTDERRRLLDAKTDAEKDNKPFPAADARRLAELDFLIDLGAFEQTLRDYEGQPWQRENDAERRRQMQARRFRFVVNAYILVLGEARNERLDLIRQRWPQPPALCVNGVDLLKADVDEGQGVVAQVALINRLDLMNERAQLVDAWRQLAVFANALLGTFNVQYHFDTFTPVGQAKPVDFGGSRYHQQLILNAQPPLVRKSERNNYRASLIAYQRQRRALMEAEDLVVQGVRGEVRQLRLLAETYKIQQRQVELAYLTVESSLDTFRAPPAPTPAGASVSSSIAAVQAASLTQQLLSAQTRLPAAQNALLTVWINYLNTRMQLYRDLELLRLDSRGVWIDELTACECGPDAADGKDSPAYLPTGADGPRARREDRDQPERFPTAHLLPPPDAPAFGERN